MANTKAHTDYRRLVTCGDSMSRFGEQLGGIGVDQNLMNGRGIPWKREAIGGTTSAQARATVSLVTRWASRADTPIALIVTGTNTYALGGTGASVYADVSAIASACKTAGFSLCYATTCVPSDTITGGEETERLAGNVLIRADADGFLDNYIDWAAESSLQVPAYDGTHFGTAQRAYAATVIAAVIFP
jgi:hypothetical protein